MDDPHAGQGVAGIGQRLGERGVGLLGAVQGDERASSQVARTQRDVADALDCVGPRSIDVGMDVIQVQGAQKRRLRLRPWSISEVYADAG
jgi:hypothetical protein